MAKGNLGFGLWELPLSSCFRRGTGEGEELAMAERERTEGWGRKSGFCLVLTKLPLKLVM